MSRPESSTRLRILQQGTSLLSASGISGMTLGLLAEQTGMSKSGLFAHFGSKDDLLLGLFEHTAELAGRHVVGPAMQSPEGLPRLLSLVHNWLGWSVKAGLSGGCPVAAGMFELDDLTGPVRDQVLQMEAHWRAVLAAHASRAVELGHLRTDLDIDQFVWELCGIYLSHHASLRFVRDRNADKYAFVALEALVQRALAKKKAARHSLLKTPEHSHNPERNHP